MTRRCSEGKVNIKNICPRIHLHGVWLFVLTRSACCAGGRVYQNAARRALHILQRRTGVAPYQFAPFDIRGGRRDWLRAPPMDLPPTQTFRAAPPAAGAGAISGPRVAPGGVVVRLQHLRLRGAVDRQTQNPLISVWTAAVSPKPHPVTCEVETCTYFK
jgi:hypothetical protein